MKCFIIVTLLFFLILAADLSFNNKLWDLNTKFTIYLQEHDSQLLILLFNFFSDWLNIFPAIALLIFTLTGKKYETLIYFCMIQFVISFNSMLKNLYHQPRPYWTEIEIQALSCNKEFGKPSGHAMQSATMCVMLPLLLVRSSQKLKNVFIYIFVALWAFMTALSRIYLGMHSIDQILLGWVYVSYFMFCYLRYLHQNLMNFLKNNLFQAQVAWKSILILSLATFTYLSFSLAFYFLNRYIWNQQNANDWLQTIYIKCQNQDYLYNSNDAQVLQNFCLNKTFEITFILYLGFWIKISNQSYDEDIFRQNFIKLPLQLKLLRLLILVILLSSIKLLEFVNSHNVWIMIFCYTIPWNFVITFVLTIGFSSTLKLLKMNIEGDFLSGNQQDGYANF